MIALFLSLLAHAQAQSCPRPLDPETNPDLYALIPADEVEVWRGLGANQVPCDIEARLVELRGEPISPAVVMAAVTQRTRAADDPIPFMLGDTNLVSDLHTHQFSELSFGQRLVLGGPAAGGGGYHGVRPGLSNLLRRYLSEMAEDPFIGGMLWHQHEDDAPRFDTWTHDGYTRDHMRQAWREGLRLTVDYHTNQQAGCAIADAHQPRDSWTCADSVNVERQLRAVWLRHEQARTGPEDGPPALVVQSPLEANHTMATGRLAVVLGVEASDYFDPPRRGGIQPRRADAYDDLCEVLHRGVGSASDDEASTARGMICAMRAQGLSSFIGTHHWNGAVAGSAFQMVSFLQPAFDIIANGGRTGKIELLRLWLLGEFAVNRRKLGSWSMVSEMGVDPDIEGVRYLRNGYGLSPLGQHMFWEAAEQGMILDLAHLSENATTQTFQLMGADRPVLLSHFTPRRLTLRSRDNWEYLLSERELQEVGRRGGVAGLRLSGEPVRPGHGPVANLCHGSVTSFAQMYSHGLRQGVAIGFATDMNGGAMMSFPRLFSSDACAAAEEETAEAQLAAQRWLPGHRPGHRGQRGIRVASTGMGHEGLLPDYLDDAGNVGANPGGLLSAGDDFVRAWMGSCGLGCDPADARVRHQTFANPYRPPNADSSAPEVPPPLPDSRPLVPLGPAPHPPMAMPAPPALLGAHEGYSVDELDSDHDGLPDSYERQVHVAIRCAPWQVHRAGSWTPARPPVRRSADGLPWCSPRDPSWPADLHGVEIRALDRYRADSDGDGIDDALEIREGTHPLIAEPDPAALKTLPVDACVWLKGQNLTPSFCTP